MGLVIDPVSVRIAGTKYQAEGPLLITHWGVSGPAILKLSSYAARHLAENDYCQPLSINWVHQNEAEVLETLQKAILKEPQKQLTTYCPVALPQRLWAYLVDKSLSERSSVRWSEFNKKDTHRLVNTLTNDSCLIAGRAAFKDEFVTCGGVALTSVNPTTLESRCRPRLFFAGEVLDIDGITGGFNFQAAWTTAYTVAVAIKNQALDEIV
jgi:predicted Rossmann fold flavoprotein